MLIMLMLIIHRFRPITLERLNRIPETELQQQILAIPSAKSVYILWK